MAEDNKEQVVVDGVVVVVWGSHSGLLCRIPTGAVCHPSVGRLLF